MISLLEQDIAVYIGVGDQTNYTMYFAVYPSHIDSYPPYYANHQQSVPITFSTREHRHEHQGVRDTLSELTRALRGVLDQDGLWLRAYDGCERREYACQGRQSHENLQVM